MESTKGTNNIMSNESYADTISFYNQEFYLHIPLIEDCTLIRLVRSESNKLSVANFDSYKILLEMIKKFISVSDTQNLDGIKYDS